MVDVERLVELARFEPGESVLDLCTGTGWVALKAKERVQHGRVVAMDIDQDMLDEAREGAEEAKISGIIEFLKGDVTDRTALEKCRDHPFSGFDVITCLWGGGLTRSHEYVAMWTEFLAPGGRLVIDYPISSDEVGILGFENPEVKSILSWEVVDSDSWDICRKELETLIHRIGFRTAEMGGSYPEEDRYGIDLIRDFSAEIRASCDNSGQPDRSFTLKVAQQVREVMREKLYAELAALKK